MATKPKPVLKFKAASPIIKKYKVIESMDALDKYDPDGESDVFGKSLNEIMGSTSTILTDPRLDPRDLKKPKNYYEWLSGPQFLGFTPYSRQVDIGMQLNLDVCWKCSPDFYDGNDVDFKWHYSEYRKRFQLMNNGVCPACGTNREIGVRKGYIFDKYLHTAICGQRSSKCLAADTLIATPDGPIQIIDFVNKYNMKRAAKVRLPFGDAEAVAQAQPRSYTYLIETNFGRSIEPNAQHRLFTVEHGYIPVAKGKTPIKVGMHLEIPKQLPLERVSTINDAADRRDAVNLALIILQPHIAAFRTKNILREAWCHSYAFKETFFATLANTLLAPDIAHIQFTHNLERKEIGEALLAWLEATGVRCCLLPGILRVNTKDFLKHGPAGVLTSEHRKHYWKMNHNPEVIYPLGCSTMLLEPLQGLLSDLKRFHWESNVTQRTRLTELYAIWANCKQGASLSTSRVRHMLKLLRPWQDIAWTKEERKHYRKVVELLRWMLSTRFAKITKITRSKNKVPVYDIGVPKHEWYIANGFHSHNSVLAGHNIGYPAARLICTGDPAAYYGLLPGTVLTCILTATTAQNAERNLYTPMRNMFTMMPWWLTFASWCKEREAELGIELIKVRENFTFFRYGGLDIRVLSPDRRRIRGSTSFATATDEICHFDSDNDKVRAGGLEVYSALSTSLTNVLGAAQKMRAEGQVDVIFPCSHAVSSPYDKNDPGMSLYNQQKNNHEALTYIYPTWKFNPNLTFEMCRSIALPATFMRDYGCEVKSTTGSFFDRAETVLALCDDTRNAIKVHPEPFTSRSGGQYTIANLQFRKAASEDMVTGLALDMGYNNNSYTFVVYHLETQDVEEDDEESLVEDDQSEDADGLDEDTDIDDSGAGADDEEYEDADESLDFYTVVVDAIGEVQPSKDNPIHFTQMVNRVLRPLIERFNVKVVVSDRWQTLQTQQDLMDDYDIMGIHMTPKIGDFLTYRQSVYAESIVLPKCEMEMEDVIALQSPDDFQGNPVAHLVRQHLTVKELPKTVEKGLPFSDDLFRVMVLAHMTRCDPEIREMLLTEEELVSEGVSSMVVTAALAPKERTEASMVMFSGGMSLNVKLEKSKQDDEEPVASMVHRR